MFRPRRATDEPPPIGGCHDQPGGDAAGVAAVLLLYIIPTVTAVGRDHHNTLAIFMLNLLLGWTLLFWIIALVWACTAIQRGSRQGATGH